MWIPEPRYHFREIDGNEKSTINSAMVALLVKIYDERTKSGLSECRLDGGDFMLEKGFEDENLSFDNILKRMKLIAARNLVQMNLDEYIEQLKKELSGDLSSDEKNIILGKRIKCPMTKEEIEKGIEVGMELRNKQKANEFHK